MSETKKHFQKRCCKMDFSVLLQGSHLFAVFSFSPQKKKKGMGRADRCKFLYMCLSWLWEPLPGSAPALPPLPCVRPGRKRGGGAGAAAASPSVTERPK